MSLASAPPSFKQIVLHHESEKFSFSDPLVQEFATRQATRLRAEGKLYNGPLALRLTAISGENEQLPLRLTVQPCDYADQAGSSFLLDHTDSLFGGYGGTLRDYLGITYRPGQLIEFLPGCFGVCGMVVTSDRMIPVPLRGRKLASMAATWGPSVAGGVDYHADLATLDDVLKYQLPIELEEELGLRVGEFTFRETAFALEGGRGLRPQLFALIETPLESVALLERINLLSENAREHDEFRWLRLDDPIRWSGDLLQSLNYEAAYALLAASRFDLSARS